MEKTTEYKGASWVLEEVKDWVDSDPDMSMDDFVAELYGCDDNFNNADPTSGQRCFEPHELESEIETALDYLKQDSDRCSGCGKLIIDEDYTTEANRVPYGDTYADETIVVGYRCTNCWEQEMY